MSQSIYDASVPTLLRVLNNLNGILDKARLHAEANKIDPAVLLASRLYPDMYPLTRQVQLVSDNAKGSTARLAGLEPPKFPDTETSFGELKERLDKTVAFLQSLQRSQFEGADARPVVLKGPNITFSFNSGWEYLLSFVLPNAYFHAATAYGILRHNGVKLSKSDFIGPVATG